MRFKVGDKCKVLYSMYIPSELVGKIVTVTYIPINKNLNGYIKAEYTVAGRINHPFTKEELELVCENSIFEKI